MEVYGILALEDISEVCKARTEVYSMSQENWLDTWEKQWFSITKLHALSSKMDFWFGPWTHFEIWLDLGQYSAIFAQFGYLYPWYWKTKSVIHFFRPFYTIRSILIAKTGHFLGLFYIYIFHYKVAIKDHRSNKLTLMDGTNIQIVV